MRKNITNSNQSWLGWLEFMSPACAYPPLYKKKFAKWFCKTNKYTSRICNNIVPGVPFDVTKDTILDDMGRLLDHYPSGSSMKSIIHFGQMVSIPKDEFRFVKFDHGEEENIIKYGVKYAPEWDLNKLNVKTVMISGTEDELSNPTDVNALYARLPKGMVKLHWLEGWNHITNLFSRDPKAFFDILD